MRLDSILKTFSKTAAKLEKFIDQCDVAMDANDEVIAARIRENDELESDIARAGNALKNIRAITGDV